jgi:2-haloalkanoic acid dehalogenase type II
MYTAILFDLDGTLIDLEACVRDALRTAFAELGYEVSNEQLWAEMQEASAEAMALHWGQQAALGWTRAQVMEAIMRDTLAALGLESEHPEIPADHYWARFCRTAHLNPGARETLQRLQGRFKLGLVTNGERDSQRGRLGATGLDAFFDAVLISDEAGCSKPDPRIFELALEALGVEAGQALYVGDSVEHDYAGAQAAGIDFCYYQPDPEAHPELQAVLRVSALDAVADWLLS